MDQRKCSGTVSSERKGRTTYLGDTLGKTVRQRQSEFSC
jgi:hypothetical protein